MSSWDGTISQKQGFEVGGKPGISPQRPSPIEFGQILGAT